MNREPDALAVSLEFGPDRIIDAGRLALDRGVAVFEYARPLVDARLALNPVFGEPSRDVLRAKEARAFNGLHGVFADSLPDAWGQLLMRRNAAATATRYDDLRVLAKLSVVGRRGMGALTYTPAWATPPDTAIDLDALAAAARDVLEGRDSDVVAELERLGGSSGGARPKVLVALDESGSAFADGADRIPDGFAAWIVKFRSSRDVEDIGPLEAAYADMARAAGLIVAETRLIDARDGSSGYFATKRFDRGPANSRCHVLSVAAALDLDWQGSTMDYGALLKLTRFVTRRQADVEMMFRRMVFNVVAHNRDDHAKQHAFMMSATGEWALAPAYDLTFSDGPGREHYLTVSGLGRNITADALLATGAAAGIPAAWAASALDEAAAAVCRFPEFARDYGVSRRTMHDVRTALDAGLAQLRSR